MRAELKAITPSESPIQKIELIYTEMEPIYV